MNRIVRIITRIYPEAGYFHITMLLFRLALSLELIFVHGLKKVGVGVEMAEHVPNPLHLSEQLNQYFATGANLVAPLFIIAGLFTRLAILPILAVTLTGYFILHWQDALLVKDVPFMYSLAFGLILILGPGKYSIDHLIQKRQI